MEAMISFATTEHRCRMQMIQDYFDEVTFNACGICDICIDRRKKENIRAFEDLRDEVVTLLKHGPLTIEAIEEKISPTDHELFVDVMRDMIDEGLLEYDKAWKLKLKQTK
jgi:ATP-dependent DNA helicase RecQ